MKRPNHERDLKIYRLIFNVYFDLVGDILDRTELDLEDRKAEKDVFKYNKGISDYFAYMEVAGIKDRRITITVDEFTCSFMLSGIRDVKKAFERRLITPRHHLYYIDVIQESKQAA